ncbi:MAG: hypothetical protein BZY83_02210 [SAR202 cluster bacterium Casp-Chloro-G2]|nr:MAG: hypothetical protein BZY83_02210 [SAR202 cluster bacterium Casp-Chloro-G2]
MPLYFLETSALVKLYVQELGTEWLLQLASPAAGNQLAILSVAQVEFHSAVRRRMRDGDIDEPAAEQILGNFGFHVSTRFLRQLANDAVLDLACKLIGRYPPRAYDAIQLAGCLILCSAAPEPPVFSCADRRLLEAAANEGLDCMDPAEYL